MKRLEKGKQGFQIVLSLSKTYLSTEIQHLKWEGHFQNYGKKIKRKKFSFVKLHSKNKHLRKQYENNYIDEFKHTLRN